ncbi:MAG: ribosome-associated translation inhibitor RaiA [bacterium]
MKINLRGKGIEITPAIHDYATKKVESAGKFSKTNQEMIFEVSLEKTSNHHKEGDIFAVEINTNIHGRPVVVRAQMADMYAAIDKVKDELVHVLESEHKKHLTLFRRGGAKIKNMIKGLSGN